MTARENPPRIPPAFDDLRHLRRRTASGWIIQHPLITPAPEPPALNILQNRPPGYSTARELAQHSGLTVRHVHRLCRALTSLRLAARPVFVSIYRTAEAKPLCQAAAQRKKLPTTPPPGYITAAAARQKLGGISPSTLNRRAQAGQLARIPARSQNRPSAFTFFYTKESIQACTTVPKP